jgi:hypothetical protein
MLNFLSMLVFVNISESEFFHRVGGVAQRTATTLPNWLLGTRVGRGRGRPLWTGPRTRSCNRHAISGRLGNQICAVQIQLLKMYVASQQSAGGGPALVLRGGGWGPANAGPRAAGPAGHRVAPSALMSNTSHIKYACLCVKMHFRYRYMPKYA